ncbi:gliding motility-associated protein GldL [Bacteroidales bacterium Barb6]|nr:gliding motility-associated protein GldL [Bacteroidales bacterium Barb6]
MGKYNTYKNRLEMFLASERGKRVLNFGYSWGASVVVLGALFKILHLPLGDIMLGAGMVTEFFVFFIYGFEKPGGEYHWEKVYPELKSDNPLDLEYNRGRAGDDGFAAFAASGFPAPAGASAVSGGGGASGGGGQGTIIISGGGGGSHGGFAGAAEGVAGSGGGVAGGSVAGGGQSVSLGGIGLSPIDVTEEDTKNLSESIKKLNDAAEQISKMGELTEVTQKYFEQLSGISDNMERFSQVTSSLTDVSDTLLTSYKHITDNSEGINQNSRGYVQQMETLNRNISGLNTIYEIQLKSISSQIDSIEHINGGLNRIREMYDGSIVDSSVFRNETEKMTRQLTELNMVYTRLLQAMTVNMPVQNPYQQQPKL